MFQNFKDRESSFGNIRSTMKTAHKGRSSQMALKCQLSVKSAKPFAFFPDRFLAFNLRKYNSQPLHENKMKELF